MSMGLDPMRIVRGVGIDQYRAGLGEYLDAVASDAWQANPLAAAGRLVDVADAEQQARRDGVGTLLSAQDASDRGRELGLRFEEPIAESAFNVLADHKRHQVASDSVFRRARLENGYGTTAWLLGGGAEFLTMAADPLNIASAFVPVVGEARFAAMASRMGRFPAALTRGAAEGAVGQLAIEPITAADRLAAGDEYGMLDTLVNVAFGAGLGTVLHGAAYGAGAGFRFVRDRYVIPERGAARVLPRAAGADDLSVSEGPRSPPVVERAADPPPRQPVAEAMEHLRPETRDAVLRTAVAQLVQDKPVDIEPVLRGDPGYGGMREAMAANLARQETEALQAQSAASAAAALPGGLTLDPPAGWQPTRDELAMARRLARGWTPEKALAEPLPLTDFVERYGGEKGIRERVTAKGAIDELKSADRIAQAATEAGYRFGQETRHGSGVDVDAFMRALVDDASGARAMLPDDQHTVAWRAQQEYFAEIARHLRETGIEAERMPARRLAWLLAQDPGTARLMVLLDQVDRLGPDSSLELAAMLDAERAAIEREVLSIEPGAVEPDAPKADHRDVPAATLEELERYYGQVERSAGEGQGGGRAAGREPAAGRAAEGGEAPPARPDRPVDPPEGAGLRRAPGEEGPAGAVPRAEDLGAFAERQASADLHADPAALALRDERLTGEARDIQALLADELATHGHLLDGDARLLFDEAGKFFDAEAKAMNALAACQMGGAP